MNKIKLKRKYYRIYIKDVETGDEGYVRNLYLKIYDNEFLSKTKGTMYKSIEEIDDIVEEYLSDDCFKIEIEEVREDVIMTVEKKKYYDKSSRDYAEKYYQKLLKKLKDDK